MRLAKARKVILCFLSFVLMTSCSTKTPAQSTKNESNKSTANVAENLTNENVGENVSSLLKKYSEGEHVDTSSAEFVDFKSAISTRIQNMHSKLFIEVTNNENGIVLNIEDKKINEAVVKSANAGSGDGPESVFSAWKTMLDSFRNLSGNISNTGRERLGKRCDCSIFILNAYNKKLSLAYMLNGTIQQDILQTINPSGYSKAVVNHDYKKENQSDNSTSADNSTRGQTNSSGENRTNYAASDEDKNALALAMLYLSTLPFSYSGLIEQLKYEGFSESQAKYAADNCGANWNEQAALKAQAYLKYMAFSKDGLIAQLEYDGFSESEAKYGVQQTSGSWNKMAIEKAKDYLEMFDFSKQQLIDQLVFDGFTEEEAKKAANAVM